MVAAQPPARLPWLHSVRLIAAAIPAFVNPTLRGSSKSAFCKRGYTATQAGAMYDALTRTDVANPAGAVTLAGFVGGQVNAVDPADTAVGAPGLRVLDAVRDAVAGPGGRRRQRRLAARPLRRRLRRHRRLPGARRRHRRLLRQQPGPGHHRPGVQPVRRSPWYTLYHKDNYPLLQRTKAAYDPHDVFRHAQSVTVP